MSKDKRVMPPRTHNKGDKLIGVNDAIALARKNLEFMIYANILNGEIWAQKEYDFDTPNVINVMNLLAKEGLSLCNKNIHKVVEPLLSSEHTKLYQSYHEGKEGSIPTEVKRELEIANKAKSLKIAIEETEGCNYLKDIPLLANCRNPLNKADFERLCAMQCSKLEFRFFFGCSDNTLSDWCKSVYGMKFKDIYEIKRQGGYISLRHSHMKMAETVPTMNKFLSINYLGLSENGGRAEEEEQKIDKLIEAIRNIE